MSMLELLEQDKAGLLSQLKAESAPEKTESILRKELDKLLAQNNEEKQEEKTRTLAARMIQTAELMLPLADSLGETRIWERSSETDEKAKEKTVQIPGVLLLVLGVASMAALLLLFWQESSGNITLTDSLRIALYVSFALASALFSFLGGLFFFKQERKEPKREFMAEKRVDAEKIVRCLQAAVFAIDQNLKEEEAQARFEAQIAESGSEKGPFDEEELALLSELLEGLCSGDGSYALDKLQSIRYFLHRRNIEIVEYTPEQAAAFDKLPGKRTFLVRPALFSDGQLLKKGLVCLAGEDL